MAQISPDPFQLPPSPEPTRWEKFTSSLAWLFEKIFAPFKFLYTATWHWKVSKQNTREIEQDRDKIGEAARQVLQEKGDATRVLQEEEEEEEASSIQLHTTTSIFRGRP